MATTRARAWSVRECRCGHRAEICRAAPATADTASANTDPAAAGGTGSRCLPPGCGHRGSCCGQYCTGLLLVGDRAGLPEGRMPPFRVVSSAAGRGSLRPRFGDPAHAAQDREIPDRQDVLVLPAGRIDDPRSQFLMNVDSRQITDGRPIHRWQSASATNCPKEAFLTCA